MSNVIRFLEDMGAKPPISAAEYAATVLALDTGMSQKHALHDRDPAVLNELLAGRKKVFCAIFADDEG